MRGNCHASETETLEVTMTDTESNFLGETRFIANAARLPTC